MYDINLLPIKVNQDQQLFAENGFRASAPPRRAARSRSEDMLIMSISIQGDEQIAAEISQSWLDNLIQSFFKTSGSVTSAMRALIETLNLTLMEKNLKLGRDIGPTTASVNLAAIHRRILYIVQSGLSHAFVLNQQGLNHFFDTSQTDRGLGFSRSPNIRFYQADIGQGSYFFTTPKPPDTWTEDALFTGGYPTLEQLRRRLLNQAPQKLRIDLAQILPGEGQIHIHQPEKQFEFNKEKADKEPEMEEVAEESSITAEVEDESAFDTRKIKPDPLKTESKAPDSKEGIISESEIEKAHAEIKAPTRSLYEPAPLPEMKEEIKEDIDLAAVDFNTLLFQTVCNIRTGYRSMHLPTIPDLYSKLKLDSGRFPGHLFSLGMRQSIFSQ